MLAFERFVLSTTGESGSVNLIFEERRYTLFTLLETVAVLLGREEIPYEVIGGMAVMVHVERIDNSAVRNTKAVDLMIHRGDLEKIKEVAGQHGFTFRHAAGVDMLLPSGETKAISQRNAVSLNAVHLIFSGEKTNSKQEVPNPALRPEHLSVHGVEVAVIPVLDLVSMKLVNNRDIDRVHIRDMDSVGLITADIEKALSPMLHVRLGEIRHS